MNNSGAGSLRQAILDADAQAGADVINFSVPGTIRLTTGALPAITDAVSIDGSTAPGFAGTPVVEVDFHHFSGLRFNAGSAGSALLSLALVNSADNGVSLVGGGSTLVAGNYIGLLPDGTTAAGNACNGVAICPGSSGNTVGGTAAQDRNVIARNGGNGVWIGGSSSDQVLGNYIGTDATGALGRGNGLNGVAVTASASGDVIGGSAGNVISGNAADGVLINGQATQTTVSGNLIGLSASGSAPLGNRLNGVGIEGSSNNLIGDNNPVEGVSYSNVISANGGNGIALCAASANQVALNYVGTDVTGTLVRGNAGNGILVTNGARGNFLGGQATGGNDPTNGVFVRPPLGNLVSGNGADGVLLIAGATQNTLSGNFIGTTASGTAALGNALDGVAIVNADGNSLVGCSLTTDPFVFYNVVSGNGGNGLRVTNSNNTTVQGNFFGLGADNQTPVGNRLNGVVVEGSSANTVFGGPIPLGNVVAANVQNGILVQGTASGFVSYNTFCGLAAFQTYTNLGNGWDGMKITSTGGNILLRTNVITENHNDGIEIGGAAQGVRVTGNIIGLDTQGNAPMGNVVNGVEVDGDAHDVLIGGPLATFSVIPHNAISANGGNGVAIDGRAHDVQVNFSYIGTDLLGLSALGNVKAGVFIGPGTHAVAVGTADPNLVTVISGNLGGGVVMRGTYGNTVVGCLVGTDAAGALPLPNEGDGIFLSNSSANVIGRTPYGAPGAGPANRIAFNVGYGVEIASGSGNAVCGNSIYGNLGLGIDLWPGANGNQAAPALTSVVTLPQGVQVSGTLTSAPNTKYTLEFFANSAAEPSGRVFLGLIRVRTNAAGVAAFTFLGPLPPDGARFITATATDPLNNTSEFSATVS